MMDNLRNVANSAVFKIIFGLIMLSFAFAGVGLSGLFSSDESASSTISAKVNGKPINKVELDYQLDSMVSQTGQALNSEARKQLRWDLLNKDIDDVLLMDYAEKNGIRLSDEQVKQAIRKQPEFMVDGKFNNTRYLQVLNASGFTPAAYAESLRAYLERMQATEAIVNSDFVLPTDLETLALKNQTRTAYIGTISTQTMVENMPKFTAEEKDAYYKAHLKDYERDDMLRVEYVGISLKDLEEKINISDDEIAKYYKDHIAEYTAPERQNVSLIRVKTKEEAEAILKELKSGADFATLAKEKSSNPVLRNNGGSLGWYDMVAESVPAEIASAKLKNQGDLSDVLALDDEFGIFKLVEVVPAKVKSLADVSEQIKKFLFEQKGLDSLEKAQNELTALAEKNPTSLEDAAKYVGMSKVEKSYWVEKKSDTYTYFSMPELNTAMNTLLVEHGDQGLVSQVVYVNSPDNQYLFLLRISDVFKKGVMPFEMTDALVERHMQYQWLDTELAKQTQHVLSELDKGNTNVLNTVGITFVKPHVLTRDSTEFDKVLIDKIFAAPVPIEGKTVYGYHNSAEKGATFFALINVKNEDKQEDKSVSQFSTERARKQLDDVVASLRLKAKIVISDTEKL